MLVKFCSCFTTNLYHTATNNSAKNVIHDAFNNDTHVTEHVDDAEIESNSTLIDKSDIAFETIAQCLAGTAQNIMDIWDVLDAFCNQDNPISNAELATAIAQNNYWRAEKIKLEEILASDEQRMAFINDPSVQLIVLKGWIEHTDIDPRILKALKECTPSLSIDDQNKILQLPDYSRIASYQKETLTPFLIDHPAIQLHALQGWIRSDRITPRIFNALEQCAPSLSPDDQNKIASLLVDWTLATDKKVMLLRFITDISPGWQQWIARDINAGFAGTDPIMLQALVKKLPIFTDPIAQNVINDAIKRKKLGTDVKLIEKTPKASIAKILSGKFD